jgi:hypothetical protein
MLREVTIVDLLKCTFAEDLDSITMETLLVRHLSTKAAQDIMRATIHSTFSMHILSFMPHLFFMGEKLGLLCERKNVH